MQMIVLGSNYGGSAPKNGPQTIKRTEVSAPPWGTAAKIAADAQKIEQPPKSSRTNDFPRTLRQIEPSISNSPERSWRKDGIGRPRAV
jgi:hypothetical protein